MLNELIETGRNILRAQPMQREAYFQWSDSARFKIAERFGANSPKTLEFMKARWEISTPFDSDPSMYLTQIGANLRRELRVLEKFVRLEGGTPAQGAARQPSFQRPAPTRAPERTRVLVLAGGQPQVRDQIVRIVTDLGFVADRPADHPREAAGPLCSAVSDPEVGAALVLVDRDPSSRGARRRPRLEAVLRLGIAAGAIGPDRVVALVDPAVALPDLAAGVRQIPSDDVATLEAEIRGALGQS